MLDKILLQAYQEFQCLIIERTCWPQASFIAALFRLSEHPVYSSQRFLASPLPTGNKKCTDFFLNV